MPDPIYSDSPAQNDALIDPETGEYFPGILEVYPDGKVLVGAGYDPRRPKQRQRDAQRKLAHDSTALNTVAHNPDTASLFESDEGNNNSNPRGQVETRRQLPIRQRNLVDKTLTPSAPPWKTPAPPPAVGVYPSLVHWE